MSEKIPLQRYANDIVAPEYKQSLKTIEDACKALGWEFVNHPVCCGKPVYMEGILGTDFCECSECGRFARDMSAPIVGNGHAKCVDSNKVDIDTTERWIVGICHVEHRRSA